MTRRPAAETHILRRSPAREPRKRLLVVCGGRQTEPDYVNGLRRHLRNPAVSVDVLARDRSPSQVVQYAITRSSQAPDSYDEVWCVVDVDQFTDLDEAVKLAARSTTDSMSITVVVSNPCFEFWLLLHFAEHRGHVGSYAQLKPLLARHVPAYNKSRIDFADYAGRYPDAVQRARNLDPSGENHRLNPSTNVWRLVTAMGG
jgi:hypothetical protein